MTGAVTLFPNTADDALFNDPRDSEVNAMIAAIPKDRSGKLPEPARIFGSLPALPGSDGSFSAVTIPGLAPDLAATYAAWQQGKLRRTRGRGFYLIAGGCALAISGLAICFTTRRKR
jgi:hypothetical protein